MDPKCQGLVKTQILSIRTIRRLYAHRGDFNRFKYNNVERILVGKPLRVVSEGFFVGPLQTSRFHRMTEIHRVL